MRLQPERLPDPTHRGLRQPGLGSHRRSRPVCVALRGCRSSVATITSSTCSSVIVRGPPGRDSSLNLSNRRSGKRLRHLPTVGDETLSRAAIAAVRGRLTPQAWVA
jgi:hypothetical protein